jgi:type I restriction enzyme, S subunit
LFRHYLKTGTFQQISTITTNIAHLGAARFGSLPFVLPPLNEQRRIVAKLDDLLARSRRAKDALDAIPALLDKLRQAILAAAFRGDLTASFRAAHPDVEPASALLARIRVERRKKWEEAELAKLKAKGKAPTGDGWKAKYEEPAPVDEEGLPELPEGWCWATLDEIVAGNAPLCYGVVQPGDESPEDGVPLVRVCDLEDGSIRADGLRSIERLVDTEYGRSRLDGGEVLVSIVGTIGRVAIAPPWASGANIARALARLRVGLLVDPRWVLAWLESPDPQQRLLGDAREVARKTLNLETLAKTPIALAPAEEMSLAVNRISDQERLRRQLAARAAGALPLARRIDSAILAKAFRGELVPQDPNDEPASAMLARLAAERADGPPTTAATTRRKGAR